jgi:class 3 adenylate cyclase
MSPMAGRRLVRVSGIIEKLKSGFAAAPPTDTITFLFSDIEGSVRLWEQHPSEMGRILARHDLLIHQAVEAHGGHTFKTVGDAFCVVFRTADNALNAALAAQRAMNGEDWGPIGSLSVRFALHTGVAEQRDGDYFGRSVNRVARLVSAAHGGQTLLSLTTEELVRENLPQDASLRDLGEHRPQGLSHPERVFELLVPDLPVHSPPILSSAVDSRSTPLRETEPISPSKSSTAPEPLSVEVEPEKEIGPIDEMVLWAGPPVVFPDAGAELVLTIDRNIQVMVEEELARSVAEYQAEGGTVIVMDPPRTFGILAMARLPDYDPGRYDDSFDRSAPPFEDPAISRQYEPGSVFKIATVAAALDSGVATPETTYYDGGEIEVGGRVTMNTSRRAYSEQTVTDVLVKPLNVGTAWLSTQMGPNAFYRYVWDFGFGRLTEVGLAGEVPGQVWLPGDIEYWHDSNLGTNSFGQGLAVTPLQMGSMSMNTEWRH